MTNSDLGRLLKAFEIQSVLRPPMYVEIWIDIEIDYLNDSSKRQARRKVKKNPLKNIGLLSRLNPYAAVQKRQTLLQQLKGRRTGTTAESKVRIKLWIKFIFISIFP
jgi:large subunit ribosomal protein L4e